MNDLLLKILPLDLAATLSPVILALAVIILGSKLKPKASTLSFILGAVVSGVIITIIGIIFGNVISGGHTSPATATIDIVLGVALAGVAVKFLVTKEKEKEQKDKIHFHPVLKWFLVALAINLTNFDAVLLLFTAAREVSLAAIDEVGKVGLWAMNIAFYSLPAFLPLVIYLIIPRQSTIVLRKIN